jgi:hypothetical protein
VKNESRNIWKKCTTQLIVVLAILLALLGSGCSVTAPKLTAEDRKRDIQYLADWARDYSPLVELSEKYLNVPSYEELLPRYLEFAEQAETHEEFYQVVRGYITVIGAYGHFTPLDEEDVKFGKIALFLGMTEVRDRAPGHGDPLFWSRLMKTISTHAHPPFHVERRESRYFTDDYWQYDGTVLPKGSEILKVNGMTCSRYLDHIKTSTWLKYIAYPKGWGDGLLMIIDEGPSFRGWQVDFSLPNGSTLAAFVPKIKGFPASKEEKPF